MNYILSFFVCSVAIYFGGSVASGTFPQENEDRRVEKFAAIRPEAGQLVAFVDLGSVQAGMKSDFRVVLKSDFDYPIPIVKMQTSCGCISLKAVQREIASQGILELDLTLTAPKDSRAQKQLQIVTLFTDDASGITVQLKYSGRASLIQARNDSSFGKRTRCKTV